MLADWVQGWLDELRKIYGAVLPQLFHRGLGGLWGVPFCLRRDQPEPHWLRRFLRESLLTKDWFELGYLRDDPRWLEELVQKESAQVARSFLICGNITDYAFDPVYGYRPTINVLLDQLARSKDCVLHFRLSQGLRLHGLPGANSTVFQKLSKPMRTLLETPLARKDASLESDIRAMVSTLHHWLTGRTDPGQSEPGVGEFGRGVALVFENVSLIIPSHADSLERNFLVDTPLHWSISPEMFRKKHCLF